jgi:hypothetical protein
MGFGKEVAVSVSATSALGPAKMALVTDAAAGS